MEKKTLRKSIVAALLLGTTVGAITAAINIKSKNETFVSGGYTPDSFVTVENFYNSGKGFEMEFDYDIPTVQTTNQFNIQASGWARLTDHYSITFNTDGTVDCDIGFVSKKTNGLYVYQVMFDEFTLNTKEGATGEETAEIINFRTYDLKLDIRSFRVINTSLYCDPITDVRTDGDDNVNGLMFRAYTHKLEDNVQYGMAIVPYEYIEDFNSDYFNCFNDRSTTYYYEYCLPLNTSTNSEMEDRFGDGYFLQTSLVEIKENNLLREFTAIPFIKDSNGKYTYANNVGHNYDSPYNCFSRIKYGNKFGSLDSASKSYINQCLNTVESKTNKINSTYVNGGVISNASNIMKTDYDVVGSSAINIVAAKGSTENAQILLKNNGASGVEYFAHVSNLTSNSSVILSKDNIETNVELYTNIKTNWDNYEDEYTFHNENKDGFYRNGTEERLQLGYWPDALMPFDTALRAGKNFLDNTNGKNQGLYFRFNIPKDAVAGTYTGKVHIYVVGEETIVIPVTLTVKDYTLPNECTSIFSVKRDELEGAYGKDRAAWGSWGNIYNRTAHDFVNKRSISGGFLPYKYETDNTKEETEYIELLKKFKAEYDLPYLIPITTASCSLTYQYGSKSSDKVEYTSSNTVGMNEVIIAKDIVINNKTYVGLEHTLTMLVNASTNDCDLLEKAYVSDEHADEPSKDWQYLRSILNNNSLMNSIDYVLTNADFTGKDKVRESLKNVRYFVTTEPNDDTRNKLNNINSVSGVGDNCDKCYCDSVSNLKYRNLLMYCPNIKYCWAGTGSTKPAWTYLSNIESGNVTLDGYKVQSMEYTCVLPVSPYPVYLTNAPMTRARVNRWRQFKDNIVGEHYCAVNRTYDHPTGQDRVQRSEEDVLNGLTAYESAFGDGLLMYGANDTYGYTNSNLYWFSTLRMENIMEGSNDFNYLKLAESLIASKSSSEQTSLRSELNSIITSLGSNVYSLTNNTSTLETARNNLLSFIDELR